MASPTTASHVGFTPWQGVKAVAACLYLVAAFIWSMPPGFPYRGAVAVVVGAPFQALGLWQSWDMFAPDPMPEDIVVSIAAVSEEGEVVEAEITDMPALDHGERYSFERWRRFCNDHLRLDANARLWPAAAEWFAGLVERTTGRRIVRLVLWRHWQATVPPDSAGDPSPRPDWTGVPFYVWVRSDP